MTENLPKDGVQSRQAVAQRCCLSLFRGRCSFWIYGISENEYHLLTGRAYEDNKTRTLVQQQGFISILPPKKNRKGPWEYDNELYKRRNEVERYFRGQNVFVKN